MQKSEKFGIYHYQTENIGDTVQTLAMMRFIPRVDYVFDRDNINATKIAPSDEVKLIMNGWYMHARDGQFDWPPKDPNLTPLLISMYLERDVEDNRADLAFFTGESREFLKKYGPVGARDSGTDRFLKENGVKSYYSGCMTLTLLPDKSVQKQDYILAVDVSDKVYEFMKQNTKREVIRMDTYVGNDLALEEKMVIAKYWLALYQSAYAVVTTRLHVMLPSLALQTPVLALRKKNMHRFEGLIDLVNNCTEEDFVTKKFNYNLDKPKANPETYKKIAESLAKKCREFTKYDERASYLSNQTWAEFVTSPEFARATTKLVYDSYEFYKMKLHDAEMAAAYKDGEKKLAEALEAYHIEGQKLAETEERLMQALNPGVKTATKRLVKAFVRIVHK